MNKWTHNAFVTHTQRRLRSREVPERVTGAQVCSPPPCANNSSWWRQFRNGSLLVCAVKHLDFAQGELFYVITTTTTTNQSIDVIAHALGLSRQLQSSVHSGVTQFLSHWKKNKWRREPKKIVISESVRWVVPTIGLLMSVIRVFSTNTRRRVYDLLKCWENLNRGVES
jgi:hypothetical protein